MGLTRRLRPGRGAPERPGLIGSDHAPPACPRCSRPLAGGTGRCPGCGAFLLGGIRLRAATFFIAVGLVLGGLGGAALASSFAGPAAVAQAPTPTPAATPTATPGPTTVAVPARARAGFAQAQAVNDRLARSAVSLRAALNAKASAGEIASILRTISADGTYGGQVAIRLAGWPESLVLADRLATFYAAAAATARGGLANALSDEAAYRTAGWDTLRALARLPDVAEWTMTEAASHGLPVPGASATP